MGFNQGQAQKSLARQDIAVRQIVFGLWSLESWDLAEARRRLDILLDKALKERISNFEHEPFWLAENQDEAFPSREYIIGQLDNILFDYLSSSIDFPVTADDNEFEFPYLSQEIRSNYLQALPKIREHLASLYGKVYPAVFCESDSDLPCDYCQGLCLHESVDGPIKQRLPIPKEGIELHYLGDAAFGLGGVLWARYQTEDGQIGFVRISNPYVQPKIPMWRRLLATLPGL